LVDEAIPTKRYGKRSKMYNIMNGVLSLSLIWMLHSRKLIQRQSKSICVGEILRLAAGKCQPYNRTSQVEEN
jgi:hypothetical protein